MSIPIQKFLYQKSRSPLCWYFCQPSNRFKCSFD